MLRTLSPQRCDHHLGAAMAMKQLRGLALAMCAGAVAFATVATPTAASANSTGGSPYFGRWTVDDANARFSVRGREYKTFDVAPCGRDFCGVSVGDNGRCGPTLFRFLSKNRTAQELKGHGKWGTAKKNVVIYPYEGTGAGWSLQLLLGDGYNLNDRGGNMPIYESSYRKLGAVRCTARV